MRTSKLTLATLAAATGAAAVLTPLATSQAASTLPRVPDDLFAPAKYLKVKPGYVGYTGDGTGVLSGAGGARAGIHWTSWTSQSAMGSGVNRIDTCNKSCAGGPFIDYPVRIEAWRPATQHGQRVFTRLTIWYTTSKRPKGAAAHYTFTDLYQNHGWGFSPPGANGYCSKTMGQPKAAGCQNITALP